MRRRELMVGTFGMLFLATVEAAGQQAWEEITGPEGRYRCRLPGDVHRIRAAGHGVTMITYVTVLPGRFAFEFVDVGFDSPHQVLQGAALATALEQMQGGMQKSFPGSTLVDQRPIMTGALAGREFVLSTDGGSRFVRTRLYLTSSAAYTATVQGPAAERQNPVVAQFIDSIQFG
ncbi:MAG: hypothetical protein KIS73_19825 [Enhydrobacter sp.]|nr:hypothetical protein [Enhydrobacter sp.]